MMTMCYNDGQELSDTGLSKLSLINVLMGDVNQDNVIDSTDANLVLQYKVGLVTFDEEQKLAADVNSDGVVDASDSQRISSYVINIINLFW